MADADQTKSVVPRIAQKRAENFIQGFAEFRSDADAHHYGSLAYFLEKAARKSPFDEEPKARYEQAIDEQDVGNARSRHR